VIIIDASVAVKWVAEEEDSDAAAAWLGEPLAAPELWLAEAANALWAKHRRGEIEARHVRDGCRELISAPVGRLPIADLLPSAAHMAIELDHPVHDCLYLAAAELHDTRLITADRRFVGKVAAHPYLGQRIALLGRAEAP
jgi:predicted nucleic acid-binding protein